MPRSKSPNRRRSPKRRTITPFRAKYEELFPSEPQTIGRALYGARKWKTLRALTLSELKESFVDPSFSFSEELSRARTKESALKILKKHSSFL